MRIKTTFILASIVIVNFGFPPQMNGQKNPVPQDTKAKTTYHDENVTIEVKPPQFAHSDERVFLIVSGKRYGHVIGAEPYYINLPQRDSILFVTQAGRERIAIHLFNLKTKKDLEMESIDGFVVSGIKDSGWVERLEGEELVLGRTGVNFKEFDYFDLKRGKLYRVENLDLDTTGKVTKTTTFEGKSLKELFTTD